MPIAKTISWRDDFAIKKQQSGTDEPRRSSEGNLRLPLSTSALKLALLSELGGLIGDKPLALQRQDELSHFFVFTRQGLNLQLGTLLGVDALRIS